MLMQAWHGLAFDTHRMTEECRKELSISRGERSEAKMRDVKPKEKRETTKKIKIITTKKTKKAMVSLCLSFSRLK